MDSDRSDSSISAVSSNSELSPNLLTFPTTMDLNYGDFPIKQKQKFIKNVDEIFDLTSQYGWYQFFVLLTIQYAMMKDVCDLVSNCPANETERFFVSLYEEDGIVCPNSHLPHHLQTIQAIGSAIGALSAGHIADRYGRKWVSYSGMLQMIIFGISGSLAINWIMLALAMFGMGFSYGIMFDASMTLACETVGAKYRIVQNLAFQWSLTIQIASLCAYLTGSWRKYLLVINTLPLPLLILLLFWIESPRWLIQQKRYSEAVNNINRISQWNNSSIIIKNEDLLHIKVDNRQSGSICALFANEKMRKYSFVMFLAALTVEMCVAVILFDVQILVGNPFLNVALYGILRIWVPLFIILLEINTSWFGRRVLYMSSQGATLACYVLILILSFSPQNYATKLLKTCFAIFGGIINCSIFFTIYKQYVMELYPTVIRALAVGAFGVIERIGGAIGPQLINMNQSVWPHSSITITTLVLLSSLVAGYIILPETRDQSMPDVLEQTNFKCRRNREK
ncbi:unnamed protein product [Dracunculus medinensis]|uniref:MFS domain-containing protein n=1 Tax=Dracunculus medinensis TaxID=318479 RepID=A0A0N4U6H6_DRAME|nr:unnamed protein product [Dracunculus medinensis]